ncbi:MAG: triose-phosphate isomerase [Bacteroidetes bacterium]|nr:triose-phosphate isomerase [Bacteroidota bacterium]
MNRKHIVANWKMNTTISEARELAQNLASHEFPNAQIVLCPPAVNLAIVAECIEGSKIQLGAQNCYYESKGAFTGEISPEMLVAVGCTYVILGHSERRHIFNETNEMIQKKVIAAVSAGLIPIICIGETLDERKAGKTLSVVETQLRDATRLLFDKGIFNIIIAYEPVWAIGTGLSATPEQAEEIHTFIRNTSTKDFGVITQQIPLLYGGSVNESNAQSLLQKPNIDGFLVGGASLKPESFLAICGAV